MITLYSTCDTGLRIVRDRHHIVLDIDRVDNALDSVELVLGDTVILLLCLASASPRNTSCKRPWSSAVQVEA